MKPFKPEEIARFHSNGATDAEIEEYQLLQSEKLRRGALSVEHELDAAVAEDRRERRLGELWRKMTGEADKSEDS